MNILVTGAAGQVGVHVCRHLLASGHRLTATDLRDPGNLPIPVQVVDLLDREAVRHLVDGHDTVVHLGNHARPRGLPDPRQLYRENVAMNLHVFDAAVDAGVKTILFASSIQVVLGSFALTGRDGRFPPPLPLDGDTPPLPANHYGLSKQTGEIYLAHLAHVHPLRAIALRLPWIVESPEVAFDTASRLGERAGLDTLIAFLTTADTARLVTAILQTHIPGYRCYQAASRANSANLPAPEAHARFFSLFPLKSPTSPLSTLIDLTPLTRDTAWTPSS